MGFVICAVMSVINLIIMAFAASKGLPYDTPLIISSVWIAAGAVAIGGLR